MGQHGRGYDGRSNKKTEVAITAKYLPQRFSNHSPTASNTSISALWPPHGVDDDDDDARRCSTTWPWPKALAAKPSTLVLLTLALQPAYALIEVLEAVGLWLLKRWGEYFAVIATSVFLLDLPSYPRPCCPIGRPSP